METITVNMQVPKEAKDIIDAVDALLEKIMAKASFSEYPELIDEVYAAVDGVSGVAAEMKSEYRDEAAGYLVQKILSRLLPVESDDSTG